MKIFVIANVIDLILQYWIFVISGFMLLWSSLRPGITVLRSSIATHNMSLLLTASWILFLLSIFSRVHAALHPALSVGRSVGLSVTLYFFYGFYFRTSLLLPKWSSDLKYGRCLPARDFGSRVSGLVLLNRTGFASFSNSHLSD